MSYIGSTPTTQSFIAGTDQFTGNGSATNWTLSRQVNSPNDIEVVIANVVQNPTSYSVSGNTLTVSPAIGNGTAFYVRYLSTTLQSITIPPGTTVNGDWGVNGNLNFFGNARRITGDFNNATVANRVMFQNSVTNGSSFIHALPNGTATQSGLIGFNNSDSSNAAFAQIGATSTDIRVVSSITGTTSYLPLTFYTGGSERIRVDTSGNVGIGDTTPSERLSLRNTAGRVSIFLASGATNQGYISYFNATQQLSFGCGSPTGTGANGGQQVNIDSSGNVGIGTTSPTALGAGRTSVDINGTTDSILWMRSNGAASGYVQGASNAFNVVGGTNQALNLTAQGTGVITATTNGTERARITTGGIITMQSTTANGVYIQSGADLSMASNATVTLTSATAGACLILIYDTASGEGGMFWANFSAAVTKVVGDGAATDTGTGIAVYKSAGSHVTTLRNRYAVTRNFRIAVYSAQANP